MDGGAGVVWGSVVDTTGRALWGAQLFFDGTVCGALSDSVGRYTLTNVGAGELLLIARLIGYGPDTFALEVGGDTIHQPIELVPVPLILDHGPDSPSWIRPRAAPDTVPGSPRPDTIGR